MNLDQLTTSLRSSGVTLSRQGDKIRASGRPSPELLKALREHKAALLCQLIAAEAVAAVETCPFPAAGAPRSNAARADMRRHERESEAAYEARDVEKYEEAMVRWVCAAKRWTAKEAA